MRNIRRLTLAVGLVACLSSPAAAADPVGASPASADLGPLIGTPVLNRTNCEGGATNVLTAMEGLTASRVEDLVAKYEEVAGYRAAVHDSEGPAVVVDRATLSAWQKRLQGTGVRVFPSCVPAAVMTAAKAGVDRLDIGKGQFVSFGYNSLTDSVDIETSLPGSDVTAAIEAVSPGVLTSQAARFGTPELVRITDSAETPARTGRLNDAEPFWGGGRTLFQKGGLWGNCSTGFYINSAKRGTVMVTAGHCTEANGVTVWNGDGSRRVGVTEGTQLPNPDLQVIDGETYAPRSYSGSNNTDSDGIVGASQPGAGITYCQMGSFTKHRCFQFSDMDKEFEDELGITLHLAYYHEQCLPTAGLVLGGDSGGGVFKEVSGGLSAKGIVVAGGCGSIYAHKLNTILNQYDATVVLE